MASKRHKRRRSCTSKIKHKTEEAAKSHAKRLDSGLPYHCNFCGGWHVGRPNRSKKQSLAAKKKNANKY